MADLDQTFTALADPTRRAMLARLGRRELSVKALAEPFRMSLPAVLKHVAALERAGILRTRKEGRVRQCRLDAAPLAAAEAFIARYREFWEKRLDALDRHLRESGPAQSQSHSHPHPHPYSKEGLPWSSLKPARSPSAPRGRSRRRGRGSSARSSKRTS